MAATWTCECGTVNPRGLWRCQNWDCPMAVAARALHARMASHKSWADMPDPADRRKRTAAARRNSPTSFEFHLDRVPAEITDPAARLKAAKSAHAAHMSKLAYARAKKRAEREAGEHTA